METIKVSPLALPFETLRYIFTCVGYENKYYNARERADDLCSFALVHSSFLHPALSLLYSNLSIRNSGRANILARTLRVRPDLAQLASKISYRSDADQGTPVDLIEILSLSNPSCIDLGARLFTGSSPELHRILRKKDVVEFGYGLSQWTITKSMDSKALDLIFDLLPTWPRLNSLAIRNCATSYTPETQNLPTRSSFPTYNLTRLEFVNVDFWLNEFSFLFGATSNRTLVHLTFRKVTILKSSNLTVSDMEAERIREVELLDILNEGDRLSKLESLYLFDLSAPFNINSILNLTTSLTTLHLGSDLLMAKHVTTPIHLPLTLQTLRIEGSNLFTRLKLFELIDPPIPLKEIILVGVLKSSPEALEFNERIRKSRHQFKVIFQSIYSAFSTFELLLIAFDRKPGLKIQVQLPAIFFFLESLISGSELPLIAVLLSSNMGIAEERQESYKSAFEAKDIELIMAHFDSNVVFNDFAMGKNNLNKAQLRTFFTQFLASIGPIVKLETISVKANESLSFVATEWNLSLTRVDTAEKIKFVGATLSDYNKEGKIVRHHDYGHIVKSFAGRESRM